MINFHRFLIATAIMFCAGFSLWTLVTFELEAGIGSLVLGSSSRRLREPWGITSSTCAGFWADEPRHPLTQHVLGWVDVRDDPLDCRRRGDRRDLVQPEERQG